MELHQLEYLLAVAEEGSVTRAAESLMLAQPSLSQQLRKLEREVGQPLFDRLPRGVVLTEAGRRLVEDARRILAGVRDARRHVADARSGVAGPLVVGAIPTVAPFGGMATIRDKVGHCLHDSFTMTPLAGSPSH
jgi:LysR family transcriptional regulator, hydrogen peroxide-inducible genes activator